MGRPYGRASIRGFATGYLVQNRAQSRGSGTMRMLANVLLRTHGKNYRVVDRSPR